MVPIENIPRQRKIKKIKRLPTTYLEKRLRIRPAGVVSKKDIGDRKMANAIRS